MTDEKVGTLARSEEELSPDDIDELLDIDESELGDKERKVVRRAQQIVISRTISPIPPASELIQYESACSGAADRIIALAERQAAHRQSLEAEALQADIKAEEDDRNKEFRLSLAGSRMAFILCLAAIIGGTACILAGRSVAGFGAIFVGLGSIAGIFIYTRKSKPSLPEDE